MRRKKKRSFIHYLAMWGCLSTGIMYTAIGVIAMLSFLRIKDGGADEGSLLVFLDKFLTGRIAIWIIMLGMISYIIWRIYETIKDPYGYGKDIVGIGKRSVTALSSLADAMIAYSAIMAMWGNSTVNAAGRPTAEREAVGNVLKGNWGDTIIATVGVVTCITAIVQFGYVISKTYMERLDINFLSRGRKILIHILAWAGHFSRGIILGIMGFFLVKAAISKNPQHVVNTDKAFDFIGDNVGHVYFIVVAAGTICYGFFMFAFGAYYDSDKD